AAENPQGGGVDPDADPWVAPFHSNERRQRDADALGPGALGLFPSNTAYRQVLTESAEGLKNRRREAQQGLGGLRHKKDIIKYAEIVKSILLLAAQTPLQIVQFRPHRQDFLLQASQALIVTRGGENDLGRGNRRALRRVALRQVRRRTPV